eukprot:scpid88911/ scgid19204/ 2-5A-dependent ribonuclease; Ribonuclease 4; Ribonuclease L
MSGLAVGAELADDTFEVVTTEDCMPCLTGCDGPEAETCLAGEVDSVAGDFLVACFKGDIVQVREFLEDGISPNAVSTYCQSSPIHLAVQGGYSDIISVLVRAGANVNVYNEEGRHPLHEASIQGRPHIASLLVECGANVNAHTQEVGELYTADRVLYTAERVASHHCHVTKFL